jgi:hypothetical protein
MSSQPQPQSSQIQSARLRDAARLSSSISTGGRVTVKQPPAAPSQHPFTYCLPSSRRNPLHLPPQLAPQPAAPSQLAPNPLHTPTALATRCTLPAHTPSAPPPPWTATAIVAMERTLTTGLSSAGRLRACVDRDKASAWPRIQRQAIEDGTECVRLRRARPPPATALLSACHQHVLSAAKRYSTPHPDERVAKAVAVAVELRPWASKGACNA